MKIPGFEFMIKNIKFEDSDEKYFIDVENKYYCEAYISLAALIRATQTKEDIFTKFLFQTFRDKK